ncbi:LVIVD repeat-containing protein [Haloarcula onubensis]|uniref:LVIVD repeat-containing protein n=1 Tax=Haloarcula onubensis TaxID=2950539 RepID=A0ABU2FJ96_9EURY|nr:hypothetical protein [Halomicroarcula sp. S3CR25-11]MDS0280831.1 hypothetical protein [Halomicroarcula sp. S3CR25-11]
MRRRTLLRSFALAGAATGAGTASAHPLPRADGDSTPASTPTGGEPLGTLGLDGARELVTSADGHTAYVATGAGVALVDLVSPSEPRLLAERTDLLADSVDGPMRVVQDLAVVGDRLLVAGPANPAEGAHGVVVFDVSDRGNPERVTAVELDTRIHNCDFDGRYAYVTANGREANPLVVLDTETGAAAGAWSLLDADERWAAVHPALRPLHDVTVRDDRAYLAYWDAGTWILDVSDPSDISLVSRVRGRDRATLAAVDDPSTERTEPPGNDHFVTVDEDAELLAVGGESWDRGDDGSGGPSGIELFDIGDPQSPESLATIDPPPSSDPTPGGVLTTAHNFELTEGRLYSAWYNGGVKVHDVRDPSRPREIFHWRDSATTSFWTAQRGAGCFAAANTTALGGEGVTPGVYTFPDPAMDAPTERPLEDDSLRSPDDDLVGIAAAVAFLGGTGLAAWILGRSGR